MNRSFEFLLVGCILSAFLFGVARSEDGSQELQRQQLVGVWRLCYEPGLVGVSELDLGYLVFLPGDRYIRMTDPVDSPRITETGTYEITSQSVVLRGALRQSPDGSAAGGTHFKPWSLRFEPKRSVVFGIADKKSPTEAAVLMPGETANYAFAKIF